MLSCTGKRSHRHTILHVSFSNSFGLASAQHSTGFVGCALLGFAIGSFAQTPGGVSGSELWFKTAPLNSDLQGYYRWQDFSGDSIRLMLLDSRGVKSELTLPNSSVHYFNFNPSLLWLADGFRSLSAKLKHGNLSQATVIGVFAPELATIGKDMVVYALDGRKGDGAILSKDKVVRGTGVEPLDYGSTSGEDLLYQSSDSLSENGFKESALRVVSYLKTNNPSTSLWGDNSNSTILLGTPYSANNMNTDYTTSLFGNNSIRGYAPELIVFSRMLTPDERRKVESYLAVKYGITLKGSYLDSEGNLIWDLAENQAYHHRVTAVGNDIAGSLLQPLSATSYEESPTYAALQDNDTYYDANPYSLSSASRLLVMGRESGNLMPDKGYTFWGDDDASLATYTSPTDSLWHIMKRTWMVKTNVPSTSDSTMTRWTAQGFEVSRNGFTDNIIQEKAASGAYAITPAFVEGGGALEFTCPTSHPTFDVGFGSNGGNTCKYGFRISNAGTVYPIINGTVSNSYIATDVDGTDISIRKESKNIYLRVDGIGSATRTISLSDAAETDTSVGIIRTEGTEAALNLTGLRTGGIDDVGYMAELSYDLTPDREFSDYCRKRTVMLIDPSGEGDFNINSNSNIRCSKPDMTRGKTIFRNILWDADGSGSDVFTFAYYDGISYDATPTPSSCENGVPRNDGYIDIGINIGTPVYSYVLSVDTVAGKVKGETIARGTFFGDTHRITNLAPGAYALSVSQGGGNEIYATGNALYTSYSHDTRTYLSGDISWTVNDTKSNYRVGLEPSLTDEITQYGFDVRGDKAHIITGGYTSLTKYVTIKPGDVLSVTVRNMQVTYKLNGQTVHHEYVWSLRAWRFCIKYGKGETHITDLTVNGTPVTSFTTRGNVQIETPKKCTTTMTVYVGSECDASMPNGTQARENHVGSSDRQADNTFISGEDENFTVNGNGSTTGIYEAKLTQDKPSAATLMVFDVSGKLVVSRQMTGESVKQADFKVPASGVYVVKAISENGEHTRKISVK